MKWCIYPTLRSLHFGKGRKSKASIHCTYKKKKKIASQMLCRENLLAEIPRDFLEEGLRGDRDDGII